MEKLFNQTINQLISNFISDDKARTDIQTDRETYTQHKHTYRLQATTDKN